MDPNTTAHIPAPSPSDVWTLFGLPAIVPILIVVVIMAIAVFVLWPLYLERQRWKNSPRH